LADPRSDEEQDMALVDDLKDYIALNSTPTTMIKEKHNVVIVGETHAFLKTTDSEIRTKAAVRLLLELLADVNCKYSTVREVLHKRGVSCVSIKVVTDFKRGDVPDDAVFEQYNKPLTDLTVGDIIRLASLVPKTPVTIVVDRSWTNGRASPFWRLTFGHSKVPVPAQFEYIVVQKA
jgi:hypothetical protein